MAQLPNINENFAEWYNEIVYQSELADLAPVKGCIVIRPYGWAIWENIKTVLDKRIKETGHQNAAFPLLIPESFLKKEASHVEGFSPELAVVTIAGGKKLEEPLVVRPTSETIIHYMFARWLKSYRDLPIKINQWCSVVRWEMRTRPFLRTTEFFWQEGHTAHETLEQAEAEAKMMMQEFVNLAHNYLAIPVITGQKSETEKFAGADKTYTYEAIMQDGKALQMGTSHLISQNFAKVFNMVYQDREGKTAYPHLTSWCGATTRLIGAVIMTHGDQKGLILPPKIAPIQVVIVPIFKSENKEQVLSVAQKIKKDLINCNVSVELDDDENKTPGTKFYHWELRGVPVRIEIGQRDIEKNQAVIADRLGTKNSVNLDQICAEIQKTLDDVQQKLFERAKAKLQSHWFKKAKLTEFVADLDSKGGAYQTGWCQNKECEAKLKEYKATIRCLLPERTFDVCFNCDKKSITDIIVAKAY